MWRYYELCTDASLQEIARMKQDVAGGRLHPKKAKVELAKRIVADFHSSAAADAAEAEFKRIFVTREAPDEVKEVELSCEPAPLWFPKLLVKAGLAKSNGEASRLVHQGGVTLDGVRVESADLELKADTPVVHLIKVGKRRFVRVRFR
jgi:tyrosyl-tRNA synthetase